MQLTHENTLPADADHATLLGRIWRPELQGPSIVTVRNGMVIDISARYPTARDVCETADPARTLRAAPGETVGSVQSLLSNSSAASRDTTLPWLLAIATQMERKTTGETSQ